MNTLILCALNRAPKYMPGAELEGCIHDMTPEYRWIYENRYQPNNINVVVLAEEQNTHAAQEAALVAAIKAAGTGEWVVYKDSSHGAEPGLVCYDSNWNDDRTFMSAKKFGDLWAKLNPQAHGYMSIDACVFGDKLRKLDGPDRTIRSRGIGSQTIRSLDQNGEHFCLPRGVKNLVTIAGCQQGKTCADVRDSLGAYGAFSHYEVPRRNGHKMNQICALINQDLAQNQFEQIAVRTGEDREWAT